MLPPLVTTFGAVVIFSVSGWGGGNFRQLVEHQRGLGFWLFKKK
jgi:hypothetical protein